jgi:hypothetical protein
MPVGAVGVAGRPGGGRGYRQALMKRTWFGLTVIVAVAALSGVVPAAAQDTTTTAAPPTTSSVTTTAPTTSPTTEVPTTPATTIPSTTTVARSTTSSSESTTSTSIASTSGGSSTGTTIGLIAAAVVVVALIVGLVLILLRRRKRTQWSTSARTVAAEAADLAAAVERGLPLLRDPGAAAQVWADLNARVARMRTRLRTLGPAAPDERARAVTSRAAQALDGLQASIETDRGLRIGPPTPTADQLGYSEAVLRQRAAELERAAEELDSPQP